MLANLFCSVFLSSFRYIFPRSLHSAKFLLRWLIKHFFGDVFLLLLEGVRRKLLFLWYLCLKNDENSPKEELLSSLYSSLKDTTVLQNIPYSFCDELWALTTIIVGCWGLSNALVFLHMFSSWLLCWFPS